MASISNALNALAALTVAGIRNHFTPQNIPDDLKRGQLPALLVLPYGSLSGDDRGIQERGEGFRTLAFSGGERTIITSVTHLLLVAPASGEMRFHMPLLVDLVDAYFASLSANPTLGGALAVPARVRVDIGTFKHGGTMYYGCALRHTWELVL